MNKTPHPLSGFTLVEILICTALAAILMTAVATALAGVTNSVRGNDGYARARNGAQRTLDLIVTKIRRAKEFALEPAGSTNRLRVMDEGTWDPGGKCWSSINAHWSIFEVNSAGELVMTLEKSDAAGTISRDGTFVLARHVRNTDFRTTQDAGMNRSVTIDLTVDAADAFATGRPSSFSVSGTAMVRSMRKEQASGG